MSEAVDLSVLLPVKGRAQQTVDLIPRLFATAGRAAWELIVVVDDDRDCTLALSALNDRLAAEGKPTFRQLDLAVRRGYWKALAAATEYARGRLLGNIANDVLPGLGWIERIIRTFDRAFPDGLGVAAWNDGLLFDGHAGHLVVGRALAERWYGPACWPTYYDHLWADVELCQRAIEERRYVVDLRAVLYHNHFIIGKSMDDIYRYSHRHEHQDAQIFEQRRQLSWPSSMQVTPSS